MSSIQVGGELAALRHSARLDTRMAFMPAALASRAISRLQIDMLVGDVEGEDAAGSEVALVEGDGLGGEQMQRDGVAGECIDDQHVEVLRRLAGERGARVAFHDVDLGGGFADIGEEILGDGRDGGIDLVKADAIAGLAVGGDGSHAEADDADVARAALAAEAQGQADAGVFSVVGGGCSAQLRREDLRAVLDGAVGQSAHGGAGVGESDCRTRRLP